MDRIFDRILRATRGWRAEKRFQRLYTSLRSVDALSVLDPLLERVASSRLPPARVYELGRRLAFESAHREPVKVGVGLLGLFDLEDLTEQLMTLGRHEEFTLYVAVAFGNGLHDSEPAQWRLAQQVEGWGRIHLVERLANTDRPEIKDWILREGFRNSIMNEYLAHTAATTGDLAAALGGDDVDDELLAAAGDILSALIEGGPAENIDDYLDGPQATRRYVDHMATRARTIDDLLHLGDIAEFLDQDTDWDTRELRGWTSELRETLRTDCVAIIEHPGWRDMVEAGLQADDEVAFARADHAARLLGIPTLPARLSRLRSHPLEDSSWYHVPRLRRAGIATLAGQGLATCRQPPPSAIASPATVPWRQRRSPRGRARRGPTTMRHDHVAGTRSVIFNVGSPASVATSTAHHSPDTIGSSGRSTIVTSCHKIAGLSRLGGESKYPDWSVTQCECSWQAGPVLSDGAWCRNSWAVAIT
ncbi:hypothetical protein EF847_14795 [Actinobacteria bacterium YIM 96077]|uniref:Uncharacterized protein n=1 Tax=Phytoactinopolyspora halophila TaxID=1981511 RepID=A0A329QTE3_9ACTN|nr:hypothetical protein [Phytoactinopolyspora halophila]AYY13772.1 hypothetical protein EF847_14795 [Actinobacteria bacterium YIM 96077]RAW15684.1 hypothetical protein DPM12_08545 [Phytoactinopolyspora halophila]